MKLYSLWVLIDEIDEETGCCETVAEPIQIGDFHTTEESARNARAELINSYEEECP